MNAASPIRSRALLALYVGAALIALSPIFVRLSPLPPVATAFHRMFLAIPLLLVWCIFDRQPHPLRGWAVFRWPYLWLAGFLFAGDLALWHWSIRLTSVANATLLANLAPVLVTALAWYVLGERPSWRFLAGLVLSLAGTALLVGSSASVAGRVMTGDLLGIATAFFYGAYIVTLKHLRADLPTSWLMLGIACITSLFLLPMVWLLGDPLVPERPTGWTSLLALAWTSQVLGQGLIAYAIAHLRASLTSVVLLLQPVLAALFAAGLFGEIPAAWQLVGGVVVLLGIRLAQTAEPKPYIKV